MARALHIEKVMKNTGHTQAYRMMQVVKSLRDAKSALHKAYQGLKDLDQETAAADISDQIDSIQREIFMAEKVAGAWEDKGL